MLPEEVRKRIRDIKSKRILTGFGWLVLTLIAGYRSWNDMFIFGKAQGALLVDDYYGKSDNSEGKEETS